MYVDDFIASKVAIDIPSHCDGKDLSLMSDIITAAFAEQPPAPRWEDHRAGFGNKSIAEFAAEKTRSSERNGIQIGYNGLHDDTFGWTDDGGRWYMNHGFSIIPLEDFISDNLPEEPPKGFDEMFDM